MSSASPRSTPGPHTHDEHHHPGLAVAVEKGDGKAEVKVALAPEELERARGQEFATLSRRVALKGFRPGKTPRALLEKSFGAEVEQRVIEHFLQHAYEQAVREAKLRPAAFPRIQLEGNLPKKGETWSFTFEILLRPEITLTPIEGLEVEGKAVEVTEEELERTLVDIRRANSRAEPAGDGPLEAEGLLVASVDFFRPGSEESCLSRTGVRLSPKTPPQGVDPASFQESLVGVRAGEQRTLEMEFPPTFPVEEARGEKGRVRLAVQEVLRVVPPADEEVFQAFEASDEASLRTAVRERMQGAKQEHEEQRIETELLERVIEMHPMQLPQQIVDEQVAAHEAQLVEKLKEQGLPEEEAAKQAQAERDRARGQAEKSLRAVYLIEEIARSKELRVEQEDIAGEIAAIAQRNGTTPEEVAKYYRDEGLLRQLGLELLERKVRRYLRTAAAVRPPA